MTDNVGYELGKLPYCCGVYEAGYFREGHVNWCDYHTTNWEKALEDILKETEGQPVLFNFYREAIFEDGDDEPTVRYEDSFTMDELRQLVMKHPNVHHIGCFVNKNSENIVDSYVIFNKEDMSNV